MQGGVGLSAKEELKNYRGYVDEIKENELHLSEILSGNNIGLTSKLNNIPCDKRYKTDKVSMQVLYNTKGERKTRARITELQQRIDLLERAVNSIKNPLYRIVLTRLYIRGKSFTATSVFMGIDRHQLFSIVQRCLPEIQIFLIENGYYK